MLAISTMAEIEVYTEMRKSVSLLNTLKHDLEDILDDITQTGVDLDAACFDLGQIHPHDVKTDDPGVKRLYDNVQTLRATLGKQLTSFRDCRDKYLEFF